jgi:hypothetical protein
MKKHLILFLFISSLSFSQTLKGIIKDYLTSKPLPTANIVFIKNYGGTNSNLSGNYSINIKNKQNDSLKITYTGYKPKFIALKDFNQDKDYVYDINLEILETVIEEVVINKMQTNYTEKQKISIKKEGDIRGFGLIGCEYALRIKNIEKQKGKIKNIEISFRRNPKANTLSKYRVKIYAIDSITRGPGEYLLNENIIISPKNKTYIYKLDVESKKIFFPEDGIFIGVELIDPDNSIKKGDIIGPGLKYTIGIDEFLTWENYRGKKWIKSNMRGLIKNKCLNIILNSTVLYKKNK